MIDFASILGKQQQKPQTSDSSTNSSVADNFIGLPTNSVSNAINGAVNGDTSQITSAGLSTIGNLLLPGVGGMIGGAFGGMIGGGKSDEQKKAEQLQKAKEIANQSLSVEAGQLQSMSSIDQDRKEQLAKLQPPNNFMETRRI
jgi:ATP-dependent protease ClpP protease subunit